MKKLSNFLTLLMIYYTATAFGQCSVNITSTTDLACFGTATGAAVVNGSGGTNPYTYLWPASAGSQTGNTATGLAAGVHCVTLTDFVGCTATNCVTITQPSSPITVTNIIVNTNVICNGLSNGSLTANVTGGVPSFPNVYTYSWSGSTQTGANITGLAAGVYCVTATDSVGCTASACATITEPSAITATITSVTNVSCFGGSNGSATVTASQGVGPYTYLWDASAGNQTAATATGLSTGIYSVIVTDANLCTATSSVTITQPATALTVNAIAIIDSSTCYQGGSMSLNASGATGGYFYQWSNGETIQTITNLTPGIYCVTVYDWNGCMASSCDTITGISPIYANNPFVFIPCNSNTSSATITPSGGHGGFTYNWSNSQTTQTATGLTAGTYYVTITDTSGCVVSSSATVIQLTTNLVVNANISSHYNGAQISCSGAADGEATAIASGGNGNISYLWGTNGYTSSIATGLSAGAHCVTATDASGCTASDCVTITEPAEITVTTVSSTNVSCFGNSDGSITISASGGTGAYSYLWYKNGVLITPMITTTTATGLGIGNYHVLVTDINGCVATSNSINIVQPTAVNISFSAPDTICAGTTTTINVTPMGGTPGYNYIWYDASVLSSLPNAGVGNHCVTVTDVNGCTASACKQINTINFNPSIQDNWSGENPRIFLGDIYNIQIQNTHPNTLYNWTPAAGLSCSNCPNPIAAPSVTTTYQLTATQLTTGCVSTDNIRIEVFTPNTNHIYIDVAPDSTVQENYPHPLWTNGSMFNAGIHYPFAGNYGIASLDTNAHQFIYTSNGVAPQVTDTFMVLICNQICDTTYFYITTSSCVWPGDTDNDGIANNMDLLPIGLHHGAVGTTRYNATNNYTCQPSRNWNIGTSGNPTVDIKHIDSDGNGTINDLDTNAIVLNWSQTHIKTINTTTTGIELYIDTATTNPGDTVSLPIILGNAQNPIAGYGIAFTINYDVNGIDTNSVSIDYNNSWLGTIGNSMIGISKDFYDVGQVQVAMTRTDHNSVIGGGTIGHIHFTIKDDVLPKSAFVRLDFEITDIRFIDHLGDTITTIGVPSQILVVDGSVGNSMIENAKNEIHVFPNPTGNLLNIQSWNEEIENIQVIDMTGKLLLEQTNIQNLQTSLNMSTLPSGMYILNIQTSTQMQQVRVLKN